MTKKRKSNGSVDEDGRSKSLKVAEQSSPSPPRFGFENPLLPLANTYDDDDDEEEYRQRNGGGAGGDNRAKVDQDGRGVEKDDDEEEDEDDLANEHDQAPGGKRSRLVEVRRDCPYLDTVNRQVPISSLFFI